MLPELEKTIASLPTSEIPGVRRTALRQVVDYIHVKLENNQPVKLNFICSHNSRRSQMAQIWAQTAADYYKLTIACYSGGIEVTAFNENAIATIEQAGFKVSKTGNDNPEYLIKYNSQGPGIIGYSKLYNDKSNPDKDFVAIMTCAEAEVNCPFIPGAEARISLTYDDPKEFDSSPIVTEKYAERSNQIGAEMFYLFSQIRPKQ